MSQEKSEYVFITERLGFRWVDENDFENMLRLDLDPEVRKYLGGALTKETVRERLQKWLKLRHKTGFGVFVAENLANKEFVGRCGFYKMPDGKVAVGRVFLQKFCGEGLGTEAMFALLKWAERNITVDYIVATTSPYNIPARKSLENVGFQYYKAGAEDRMWRLYYKIELKK